MSRRTALPALALAAALGGCSGLTTSPPHRYFVLDAAPTRVVPAAPARDATLLVAPTTASSFYDTQEIIHSRRAGERGYYQFSSWTEPPNRALASLLAARISQGGAFRGVAETGSSVRGGLLLRTHLVEIYHDAGTPPGTARVVLRAELSDPTTRTLLARRTFSASVPASSFDAVGAVQGFGQALGTVLDDVAAWAAEAAASGR